MALTQGVIQLRGDFGNPSGSGLAKLVLHDLTSADSATAKTALNTFGAALKTDGFTLCNIGDISVVDKTLQFKDKPGGSVNVDSKLEVTWRTKTDDTTRSLTISGIAETSTQLESADDGKRLTDAGKVALAAHLTTLYGLAAEDAAVVLYGKFITTH